MQSSAFGVEHLGKTIGDRDDPAMKSPIGHKPAPVDAAAIRGKLRAFSTGALKTAKRV
jgi:hypothetical protein